MHELTVTRYIDAAPERVWDVMANRQEDWWCPKPWTLELVAQERRPGGRSAMIMRGPEGEAFAEEGIFLAWDEGRRIVVTDAVTADLQPKGPFMIGFWEIEPEGQGTRYTARARHWSEVAQEKHLAMGFHEGWKTVADQLAELCEQD